MWLVLDIVGAALGLLITLPVGYMFAVEGELSPWLPSGLGLTLLQVVIAVATWGAAAIARLSPKLALMVGWAAAFVQMAAGLPPAAYNLADFVVVFAAAAWGSKRILWLGGASALATGVIAGGYTALQQSAILLPEQQGNFHVVTIGVLIGAILFLALVLTWGAGLLWRVVVRERAGAEARRQAEVLAVEEQERVRIARDMHDVVAHSLAVVIAQSDGARYAAAADPEAATKALTTISQTARGALSDVRMLLTQLRHRQGDGPQPTLADLETLFAHVRQAGIEPCVTVDPTPSAEPPASIQLAVYRILQEALTNAIRHGAGAVDVRLAWWADRMHLDVRNPVSGVSSAGGGHGVIGMRERAQLVGGTLCAERRGDEFVVHAELPIGESS